MAELSPDAGGQRILAAVRRYLADAGEDVEGLTVVGQPKVSARSTIYRLGRPGETPSYVVKVPFPEQPSIDADPPLTAVAQFEALQRARTLVEGEDAHAVARPVAILPEQGALILEYVPGATVSKTVQRSVFAPRRAERAVAAAGDALRRLHRRARKPASETALADLVDDIRASEASLLGPAGLSIPDELRRVLDRVPGRRVRTPRVLLHGDYVGLNLILAEEGRVTIIDPLFASEGLPDDDVTRFLAVLSSAPIFRWGMLLPQVRKLRQHLERTFLSAYADADQPLVLELRLIRQHIRRWRRVRELSRLSRSPPLMNLRRRVVDHYMRRLLMESSERLSQALSGAEDGSRNDARETHLRQISPSDSQLGVHVTRQDLPLWLA